jgi:hypothetical protein
MINGSGADAALLPSFIYEPAWAATAAKPASKVRTCALASFSPEAPRDAGECSMDFVKDDCFGGGPLLDQPAVLVVLSALFLLFAWRTFRRPAIPRWSLGRRPR